MALFDPVRPWEGAVCYKKSGKNAKKRLGAAKGARPLDFRGGGKRAVAAVTSLFP